MTTSYDTDVLVIGGGSTGLGITRDLAKRGLGVILAEQGDLREGTSGRYHGLLHSGGRYAVNDPETARECIVENRILRRIMPHAIEDTGGLFVTTPADPPAYADRWLAACRAVGVPAEEISVSAALKREPALNRGISRAFTAPDAACDSFDALASVALAAEANGAKVLIYHSVVGLIVAGDRVIGARLRDHRGGGEKTIAARMVVNATGPWAGQVAALAGIDLRMKNSRGALVALNIRWVNTIINRCRPPGDGDILVPVGTVCVLGTTSVRTDDPFDTRVEPWEVSRILEEANHMIPGVERTRALRAWAGVRPIYDPSGQAEGREAKRTFEVLDHETRDGIGGLVSVVGGKLTTYRLMAEKAANVICAKLSITAPCTTADETLPPPPNMEAKPHYLGARLNSLEHGETPGELICECEIVTRPQIARALAEYDHPPALNDLRRDLRIGMGPCQGGFCAFRTAAIRHEVCGVPAEETVMALAEFAQRRFGGVYPLLWGHNLRQVLFDEIIARRVMGRVVREGDRSASKVEAQRCAQRARVPLQPALPDGRGKRIVVVGAGLAGLTAALTAAASGAQVHLVAAGVGKTHISPGWLEVLDTFDDLDTALARFVQEQPNHPYALADLDALYAGLDLVCEAATAHGAPLYAGPGLNVLVTMLTGLTRRAALVPRSMAATSPDQEGTALIVGFKGWRDFYPALTADNLNRQGFAARALCIDLPEKPKSQFDYWPVDLAHLFEKPTFRADVVRQVRPHLDKGARVGFPAVLGLHDAPRVQAGLEDALGAPVFEIPTLPPSVPGMRLYHALREALMERGARFTVGPRVTRGVVENGRCVGVAIETASRRERLLRAEAVILATGGLFGGGLESNHKGEVWETIFNLPLEGPIGDRGKWFLPQLLPPKDRHPVHQIGVRADAHMRPIAGAPEGLYVCGRLLAGYDPLREGTSEGVAIATGYRAGVEAVFSSP